MDKTETGFIKLDLDPAVQAALVGGSQRRTERSMPKQERKKLKRSKEKQAARNGNRAVYDLESELINAVKELADKHGTSASQVAGIALHYFLQAIECEEINLADYRVRLERNPRYVYKMTWRGKSRKQPDRGTA